VLTSFGSIIQDSPDGSDWKEEATRMGDVYANSYITLAATASPDSEGGLLHTRSPLSVWPCRTRATWTCFPAGELVISVPDWATESDLQPLASRAWVFQEWLLSKRLLHFGKDQVRWQCFGISASEVYPDGFSADESEFDAYSVPSKSDVVRLLSESRSATELWSKIREDYSHKSLTRPGDRLPAFIGIARMAHKALKSAEDNYIAGLQRSNLLEEMLWQRDGEHPTTTSSDTPYIAPSWSWASIKYPFLRFDPGRTEGGVDWVPRVVSVGVVPTGDAFGLITGGSLTLETILCFVTAQSQPAGSSGKQQAEREWTVSAVNGATEMYDCSLNLDDPRHPASESGQDVFIFLPVRVSTWHRVTRNSLTGLLLEQTRTRRGQYRRIGLLNIFGGRDQQRLLSSLADFTWTGKMEYLETAARSDRLIEIV
jgi:hypothetical protein